MCINHIPIQKYTDLKTTYIYNTVNSEINAMFLLLLKM